MSVARALEAALVESFQINGPIWGADDRIVGYSLSKTTLGDVKVEKEPSGTWRIVQGAKVLGSGIEAKEKTFWKDVQRAIDQLAMASAPAEFDFKTSADVKAWMDRKIKEYGSKTNLLTSPEYAKAFPFIKKVNDAERAASKSKDTASAEAAMAEAGLKYGDRVFIVHHHFLGATRAQGKLVKRGQTPSVEIDEKDRPYFPRSQKFVPWNLSWKKL